jgi:hypothetical protein
MGILQDRDARNRVLPFVVFIALLALRGICPDDSAPLGIDSRVLYALQAGAAGALLLLWWRGYAELLRPPRLGPLALSVGVGLAVCWVWVTLDEPWMRIGEASASFEPIGDDGRLLWGLIAVRWLGATLVVPVMEALFWRGFSPGRQRPTSSASARTAPPRRPARHWSRRAPPPRTTASRWRGRAAHRRGRRPRRPATRCAPA